MLTSAGRAQFSSVGTRAAIPTAGPPLARLRGTRLRCRGRSMREMIEWSLLQARTCVSACVRACGCGCLRAGVPACVGSWVRGCVGAFVHS